MGSNGRLGRGGGSIAHGARVADVATMREAARLELERDGAGGKMRRKCGLVALTSLLLSVACSMPVSSDAQHDWAAEPHHISALLASTLEEDESAATLGIDYEYRVDDFMGIGAVVEYAFGDIDALTILGVADLHVTREFIVQTGPGVEYRDEGNETEWVYRLGALYEWELGDGYTLSPQLHYDWTTGEDAFVIGFAFGVAF